MSKLVKYILRFTGFLVMLYLMNQVATGHWGLKSYFDARKERAKLNGQLNYAMAENGRHKEELEAFKKDPLFLEEQVKINLKKGRKGEVYYHFSDKTERGKNDTTRAK
jgi:cell division protein FtsB